MDASTSEARLGGLAKAFIARRHKLLIDGQWVEPKSGKTFAVFDPSNGQQIAQVAEGGAEDIDLAVKAARRAFETGPWSKLKPVERGKLVWKLGDVLEAHADELAELESLDNGKPIRDARSVDLPFGCELLRYMGGWSTKITGQQIPISAPGEWHAYSMREPVGVVGQIIPWNFPLLMAVWKIAPALAAGCTIVLKPAEQTPLTAIRLGELIVEAGFPPGVVNVVTGDGTAGAALAAHPDVDKVAFTGSTEVGKLIVQAAAGNLKKVSLELGGKSPAIAFPDADLGVAIPGTASGIFFNMGQCCTAGSRLFVHERVFDKMMTGLSDEAAKLTIGPGLDPATRIGPLVSDEQFQRVTGFLESGRQQGAEVVTGGKRHGNEGYFVEPTILTKTTPEMKVVREEIFGPVVCAIRYDDDDLDRIAREANATEYGLAASIWTRDIGIAHKLAKKLKAGSVWINVHNFNDVALPFGGYKQSGWGREMGYEAIELYTETKAVAALLGPLMHGQLPLETGWLAVSFTRGSFRAHYPTNRSGSMTVQSAASRQARLAPAQNFTGSVFQDPLARAEGASRTNATTVTFVPGARTVWHKHDMRQVLVVTTGLGILQVRGEKAQALRPGDVATVQPGVDHWHGASANSLFAHISLLESRPEGTEWGQPVSGSDYESANSQIAE